MAYHCLMGKHCRKAGSITSENQTQSEARELPTSRHKGVMEGTRIQLIVFIVLYYT